MVSDAEEGEYEEEKEGVGEREEMVEKDGEGEKEEEEDEEEVGRRRARTSSRKAGSVLSSNSKDSFNALCCPVNIHYKLHHHEENIEH